MYRYFKIDEDGYFIGDVVSKFKIEDEYLILTPLEGVFYRPRWDGKKWLEGASIEYIKEVNDNMNEKPLAIEVEEELTKTQQAIVELFELLNKEE